MSTTHDDVADLNERLDRLARSLDVPDVTEQARARGRRLRTRRRTTVALAGLAAAAVVPVGVPTVTTTLGGDEGVGVAGSVGGAGGPAQLTARELANRLMPLLPAGSTASRVLYRNTDRAPGEKAGPLRGYLALTLDTGPAAGGVNLVFFPKSAVGDPATGDARSPWSLRCPADATSCTVKRDVEGAPYARQLEDVDESGVTTNTVTLLRPDGSVAYLATANSSRTKWVGPPTSARPPLTLSQMLAVVDNETWDR